MHKGNADRSERKGFFERKYLIDNIRKDRITLKEKNKRKTEIYHRMLANASSSTSTLMWISKIHFLGLNNL